MAVSELVKGMAVCNVEVWLERIRSCMNPCVVLLNGLQMMESMASRNTPAGIWPASIDYWKNWRQNCTTLQTKTISTFSSACYDMDFRRWSSSSTRTVYRRLADAEIESYKNAVRIILSCLLFFSLIMAIY